MHGKCHEVFSGGRRITTACVLGSNWEPWAPLQDVVYLSCSVFAPVQQTFSDASLCPGHGWFSPETSNTVSVSSVFRRNPWWGQGSVGRQSCGRKWKGVRQGGPSEEMLPPVSGLSNTGQCPRRWAPRLPGAGWDRKSSPCCPVFGEDAEIQSTLAFRCSRDPETWVLHKCKGGGHITYLFCK